MRDVLAAIGLLALVLALLLAAVLAYDPALAWRALESVAPRPAGPPAPPAAREPAWARVTPTVWSNIRFAEATGGERVSTRDGQVVEEWVTLYRWRGSGPRDLGEIDIPSEIWRIQYSAQSSATSPFGLSLVGPADQSFSDALDSRLPRVIYRQGRGRYRAQVTLSYGGWDIQIQVPAEAVR